MGNLSRVCSTIHQFLSEGLALKGVYVSSEMHDNLVAELQPHLRFKDASCPNSIMVIGYPVISAPFITGESIVAIFDQPKSESLFKFIPSIIGGRPFDTASFRAEGAKGEAP